MEKSDIVPPKKAGAPNSATGVSDQGGLLGAPENG
jgi:hypothetical protein